MWGGGADGRTIEKGVAKRLGWDGVMIQRRTFSGRGIRYSAAAAAANDNNNNRGDTAPLTPSSAALSPETMTRQQG